MIIHRAILVLCVLCALIASFAFASNSNSTDVADALIKKRTDQIEDAINFGDVAEIQKVHGVEAIPILYNILALAATHQFNRNEDVKRIVIDKLSSIPGHGKYLGARIDRLSEQMDTTLARDSSIFLLKLVKSEETIEELGRLLFDQRLPEASIPFEKLDRSRPISGNDSMAAESLHSILGNNSPLPAAPGEIDGGVQILQRWWNSPAGEAYRQSLHTASLQMPQPSVTAPVSEIRIASPIETKLPSQLIPPPAMRSSLEHLPWIVSTVCGLAITAIIWWKYRRRRSSRSE